MSKIDSNPSALHANPLPPKMKVFVTGLSSEMTRRGLTGFFKSMFPSTTNFTSQCLGSKKRKISGFGFLVLRSKKDVEAVLKQRMFFYKGRNIKAEPYLRSKGLQRHKESLEKKRVFVGRIPAEMESDDLQAALEDLIGPVERAYVVSEYKNSKKRHKGFGYAVFLEAEVAEKALEMGKLFLEDFEVELNLEKPKGKKSIKNHDADEKSYFQLIKNKHGEGEVVRKKQVKKSSSKKSQNRKKGKKDSLSGGSERSERGLVHTKNQSMNNHFHNQPKKLQNQQRACFDEKKEEGGADQAFTRKGPSSRVFKRRERVSCINQRETFKNRIQSSGLGSTNQSSGEVPEHQEKARTFKNKPYSQIFNRKTQNNISWTPISSLEYFGQNHQKSVFFTKKKRKQNSFGRLLRQPILSQDEILDSDGWKRYSLKLLNHSASNIQINLGRPKKSCFGTTRLD